MSPVPVPFSPAAVQDQSYERAELNNIQQQQCRIGHLHSIELELLVKKRRAIKRFQSRFSVSNWREREDSRECL